MVLFRQFCVAVLFFCVHQIHAQGTAGFNSSFIVLAINGGANAYYDLQASTSNPDFNTANLGTFTSSNSLVIKGAEHNVWKCGGCDLTSTRLYYRIYATGVSPGSFTNLNIPWSSGGNNGCGGQDQQWQYLSGNIDVLACLIPGSYTLEVYSDASITCGGSVSASNNGSNYKASFSVGVPLILTNGGSNLSCRYSTLENAISALNSASITSPVIITVYGPQTAPDGTGYLITQSGTLSNPITIEGISSIITSGLNSSGGELDAVFKLNGSDYITIQNFQISENNLNINTSIGISNTMTEAGILIIHSDALNGANNNSIINNIISLNSSYPNNFGILSTSASTTSNYSPGSNSPNDASNISGTNSNNKIYSNSISNVTSGIYFICGPSANNINESGNDIGGSSTLTANTITFGTSSTTNLSINRSFNINAGIFFSNGTNFNVKYNNISSAFVISNHLCGICNLSDQTPQNTSYSSNISNNLINISSDGLHEISGIDFGHGVDLATFNCTNNDITINQNSNASVLSQIFGIKSNYSNSQSVINLNSISIFQTQTSGLTSSDVYGIKTGFVQTGLTLLNNQININQNSPTLNGSYSGLNIFIDIENSLDNGNVSNNTLTSSIGGLRTTGIKYGIKFNTSFQNGILFNNNSLNFILNSNSGAIYGLFESANSNGLINNISNNNILFSNLSGSTNVYGINTLLGAPTAIKNITNNNITITGNNTGISTGINIGNGYGSINNNIISINNASTDINGIVAVQTPGIGAYSLQYNNINLTSSCVLNSSMKGIQCGGLNNGPFQITNNSFSGLNFTGAVTGNISLSAISISGGISNNLSYNVISNVSSGNSLSSGRPTIDGILIFSASSNNIFKNKIYNMNSLCSGLGLINGITLNNGSSIVYNNLISGLSNSNSTNTDAIRGISIRSTAINTLNQIYNNTIYLTGSGGTNFGGTGIYHVASSVSTTSNLILKNNLIIMLLTPNGTGYNVAYRRSSNALNVLNNYSTLSNNNLFYAGIPSSINLIFSDGFNLIQNLPGFISGSFTSGNINPRESNSVTENSFQVGQYFASINGISSNFLKPINGLVSQIESGAITISNFNDDFSSTLRPNVTGYSWDIGAWEFDGGNQALPVALTSFSGNCADGKVVLEWSTATEHNSDYFQVEYSRDGEIWQNIGEVAAAGNSEQNINYTLTPQQVANGNNYYRLRQVDIDGVEKLYDVIAVTCAAGSDPYIMSYPNPSEQNFQVALLDENLIGTATLSMVDARGVLIHSELLEVKAGTNLFLFNNKGLAPGIYYVKISKGAYSSEVVKQVVR